MYPIHLRGRSVSVQLVHEDESVILDMNKVAEGQEYLSIAGMAVSPNNRYLAWLQDDDGAERFRLRVRDLQTGQDMVHEVSGCKWSLTFAADNQTIFYTRSDHAQRPHQIWRHNIHTDSANDQMVHAEPDERFFLSVRSSRDHQFVFLSAQSKTTSELHAIRAQTPAETPQCIWPRIDGVECDVSHSGDRFFFRTNQEAENFRLLARSSKTMPAHNSSAALEEVIAHRREVLLENVHAFARHVVLTEKHNGLGQYTVLRLEDGHRHTVVFPDETYEISEAANAEFYTNVFRYTYTSLAHPESTFAHNMDENSQQCIKQRPVGGNFQPGRYAVSRTWATANDGAQVPISVIRLRSTGKTSPNPAYLIGYGSYGYSYPALFSSGWLSLVDRGVTVAIAHIRGGQEMGRHWYLNGKADKKTNTFTDFIACAEHLIATGLTSPDQLAINGGSAGGLLMGAVINMRSDLFRAVVAQVPFVDVLTTMLDDTLPLTVTEYDEWGNPNDPKVYETILSYSPYDNLKSQNYPSMLVTAGLNDPRVGYWEPAKWVAQIRTLNTADSVVLLRTHMGAGHGG